MAIWQDSRLVASDKRPVTINAESAVKLFTSGLGSLPFEILHGFEIEA
jgi:hypothetical protein